MAELISYQKKPRQIYAYTVDGQPGIKVGDTTKDNVADRVNESLVNTPNQQFHIVWSNWAIADDGTLFRDYDMHKKLAYRGVVRIAGEWFDTDIETIKSVFLELKTGKRHETGRTNDYPMRPEQADAVAMTSEYFTKYSIEKESKAPHFLWNAKMRFGKTFTAYELAKNMGWKRILVLTYKPATEKAWRDDLMQHVDFEGWQFIGGKQGWENIDESKPVVWFASYQDVLGRDQGKTIKERHSKMREETWDCLMVDEYHFGAWQDSAKELTSADGEDGNPLDSQEEGTLEDTMPLNVNSYLYLSGTPFRAMSSGEFSEDQIFNWSYADEQRVKENWKLSDGENPYMELPQIVMMTYQMPERLREVAMAGEFNEFDLNKFFGAKKNDAGEYVFTFENQVQQWLDLLRGVNLEQNVSDGMDTKRPPLLFEDARLLSSLRHTFWFLPSVASCKAMERLLNRDAFFSGYKIVRAAGSDAGIGQEAIEPVERAIGNPFENQSITLSCGKLTTGVTIPAWSGVLFLRNTTSPETYFQTGFRAQSPWKYTDENDEKFIVKPTCYIFDFAPSRALKLVSDYIVSLDVNDSRRAETKVADFLGFLPVLCYDGYSMQQLKAVELLDIATFGTASTMLAKRWQSARLIDVTNITLEKLLNAPDVLEALEKIESFRGLGNDISKTISSEKALNTKKKEGEKLTPAEKKEEKENKGFKKQLREKLLKFITRIPVFMYLTDYREEKLTDVIRNLEPELFTRVTGLTVRDFDRMCEIGVFNSSQMEGAIFQFRRFEDSSLNYAGGNEQSGDDMIGGFDSVVTRDEADEIIESVIR